MFWCIYSDEKLKNLYLIFELFDMNLFDYIKNRSRCLSEVRVKRIMYQLTAGLNHLHRSGIFHRDIKPENILVKIDSRFTRLQVRIQWIKLILKIHKLHLCSEWNCANSRPRLGNANPSASTSFGLHFDALVSGARVNAHRWILWFKSWRLGAGMCLLRTAHTEASICRRQWNRPITQNSQCSWSAERTNFKKFAAR